MAFSDRIKAKAKGALADQVQRAADKIRSSAEVREPDADQTAETEQEKVAGKLPESAVVTLAAGSQIELETNLKYISSEAEKELLGNRENDEIEKSVKVLMHRDIQSQFKNSVRLVTQKGHLIGWVSKADSDLACKVIDETSKAALKEWKKELKGRFLYFEVSARVEGYVNRDGSDVDCGLDDVVIRIKDPVSADLRR